MSSLNGWAANKWHPGLFSFVSPFLVLIGWKPCRRIPFFILLSIKRRLGRFLRSYFGTPCPSCASLILRGLACLVLHWFVMLLGICYLLVLKICLSKEDFQGNMNFPGIPPSKLWSYIFILLSCFRFILWVLYWLYLIRNWWSHWSTRFHMGHERRFLKSNTVSSAAFWKSTSLCHIRRTKILWSLGLWVKDGSAVCLMSNGWYCSICSNKWTNKYLVQRNRLRDWNKKTFTLRQSSIDYFAMRQKWHASPHVQKQRGNL